MPDRLTERVSAAIAAEAEQRAAGFNAVGAGQLAASSLSTDVGAEGAGAGRAGRAGGAGGAGAGGAGAGVPGQTGPVGGPGRPDLPRRSRRRRREGSRRSIWTSPLVLGGLATAGVFVFIIGAVFALSRANLGPSSGSAGRPAAGRPAAGRSALPAPVPERGPLFGANSAINAAAGVHVRYQTAGRTASANVYLSPVHFTRSTIGRSVRSVGYRMSLAAPEAGTTGHSVPHRTTGTHHPQSQTPPKPARPQKVGSVSVAQIARCLSADAPSGRLVIVEIAHYQGKPAIIMVGRLVADAYHVTVTGLACSASKPDVLARITVPKRR
jgi:hypothetical protein